MRELRHICSVTRTLPTSCAPQSQDLQIGQHAVASGGSGDIYEGTLDGTKVCAKRIRVYANSNSGGPPEVRSLRPHPRTYCC